MRTIGIEYPAKGKAAFCDIGKPPDPNENEILIRTIFSGITNGTERHALMAEHLWGQFPSRHGYQHVGVIEKAGKAVKNFSEGDKVFFGHYVGHRAWNVVDVASPLALANHTHLTIRLPEHRQIEKYRQYALLGVAGVSMRGARRFRVGPTQNVWIAGVGLIGQFAAQACRALGATVTVTDINPDRLAKAKELGAHCVLDARDASTDDQIRARAPYDVIIDCAGHGPFVRDLFEKHIVKHGFVIGLLAVRTDTVFHWSMLHIPEGSIEVSCHFSVNDLQALLDFMREKVIRSEPLINTPAPIDQALDVYKTLREKPGQLLGVVFDWR